MLGLVFKLDGNLWLSKFEAGVLQDAACISDDGTYAESGEDIAHLVEVFDHPDGMVVLTDIYQAEIKQHGKPARVADFLRDPETDNFRLMGMLIEEAGLS